MNRLSRRTGFTLIEVLIVVVIMAVLAATIIPQFSASTKDAKESAIKFNLHSLRSQIELYKMQHNSTYPTGANDLEQLTKRSNAAGTVIPSGGTETDYPFGPYVQGTLPVNPFTNSYKVRLHTGAGAPTASGAADAGYHYKAATGEIWIDHADYLTY
jgi:type II secretion system protein G